MKGLKTSFLPFFHTIISVAKSPFVAWRSLPTTLTSQRPQTWERRSTTARRRSKSWPSEKNGEEMPQMAISSARKFQICWSRYKVMLLWYGTFSAMHKVMNSCFNKITAQFSSYHIISRAPCRARSPCTASGDLGTWGVLSRLPTPRWPSLS